MAKLALNKSLYRYKKGEAILQEIAPDIWVHDDHEGVTITRT